MIGFRSDNTHQRLGKSLEKQRLIKKDQFKEFVRRAREENRLLTDLLYEDGGVPAERLLHVVGDHYGVPTVLLREKTITPYVLNLIPKDVAEQHGVVIFKKIQNIIHVATTDPGNQQTLEFVRKHTQLEPEVFLTTPDDLRYALERYRTELSEEFSKIIAEGLREAEESRESAAVLAQHVPIVNMVNSVIHRALTQLASDIHLEPGPESVVIRFRVDGLLRKVVELPPALLAPLVARLKLMANLKIDEHRQPQDGRFSFDFNNREVAVRVSVVPTLYGAKIVLRLLDAKLQQYSLRTLGLNQRDYTVLKQEITKPNGMILVTGPTGSGKTTTLYTLLQMLNTETVNICTIEDPVEYGLPGINQTQVNPAAHLTFANGLRSLLRQDPNVIMVGEIRDPDTADIAVNAAMTGHLVLSTLHTNSAPQTVQRLIEMGVQPYLAASTINLIVAQRLVRKVCRHCRQNVRLSDKLIENYGRFFKLESAFTKLRRLELLPGVSSLSDITIGLGRGCEKCQDTGYLGRIGIYELLPNTEQLHAAILNTPHPSSLAAAADRQGQLSIVEDGLLKVFSGLTTFDEILRVTKT